MKKTEKVKITVQGGGLSYKGAVSKSIAGQVIAFCLSSIDGKVPLADGGLINIDFNGNSSVADMESASEYFNRYAPKRNPDKILTLACFLAQVKKQKTFTVKEVKSLFRDVGEILPANFTRDFEWASKINGWITRDTNSKDAYYVTRTGFGVLEEGFSRDILKKTKISHRRATKK